MGGYILGVLWVDDRRRQATAGNQDRWWQSWGLAEGGGRDDRVEWRMLIPQLSPFQRGKQCSHWDMTCQGSVSPTSGIFFLLCPLPPSPFFLILNGYLPCHPASGNFLLSADTFLALCSYWLLSLPLIFVLHSLPLRFPAAIPYARIPYSILLHTPIHLSPFLTLNSVPGNLGIYKDY